MTQELPNRDLWYTDVEYDELDDDQREYEADMAEERAIRRYEEQRYG